ncbi:MAG: phospholipase D family protein [Hyphomonadaceae bacterium]|nr:phospholipase D family protein [Hyphomonadaceae bacterium]
MSEFLNVSLVLQPHWKQLFVLGMIFVASYARTAWRGGQRLAAVREIASGDNPRFAVAFWGRGAPEALGLKDGRYKIICNLEMGGTNPHVIRALDAAEIERTGFTKRIRQRDDLHAKVFICDHLALVGSANASANGLGFEGAEAKGWLEAGIRIDDPTTLKTIADWFANTWKSADRISGDDIERAVLAWKQRRRAKPTLLGLNKLDPDADDVPLINWWGDGDYEVAESVNDDDRLLIDDSVEIEHDDDRAVLFPGRWVLYWKRNLRSSLPNKSAKLELVQLGRVAASAVRMEGGTKFLDVALRADEPGPPPFEITDEFTRTFKRLIAQPKYAFLRRDEYDAFFAPAIPQMRELWRELKSSLNQTEG